jgi:hypothetical protein
MVDYTKGTGNGGTMLIRDLGLQVQFHLQAGLSATFVGSPGFRWDRYIGGWVGGTNWAGRVANYSNREWRHVASYDIGTTQDIAFKIDYTGTEGFGGPTEFWQRINRATVPGAPTGLVLSLATATRLGISYSRGGNGGSAILQDRATWYEINGSSNPIIWTDDNCVGYTDPQDGVAGPVLKPYTEYHVYIQSRNAVGWGAAAGISVRTLAGARVFTGGAWKTAVPYVFNAGAWRMGRPYVFSGGVWQPAN